MSLKKTPNKKKVGNYMQKSFHVNKTYNYLIPFLNEQPNISRYLCELVAKDYSNQLKTMEMTELAELVSTEIENRLTSQLEVKLEQLTAKFLQNMTLEIVKQPVAQEYVVTTFVETPPSKKALY